MTGEFVTAVHALTFLNHTQRRVSSADLAKNVCTNPARIRKVMGELKNAGLVDAGSGAEGGYLFIGAPENLTLRMVAEALGERPVRTQWRTGDVDAHCLISSGMASVMDGICADLSEDCLKKLGEITVSDIDRRIFGRKD